MYSANFYIVKTNGQQIIRDHKSELQIKIYDLDVQTFNPNHEEFALYGSDEGVSLAFETVNNKAFGIELVAYALSWYVDYSGQFNLHISYENPQADYPLKRA